MEDPRFGASYQPYYDTSHALLIGISAYDQVGPPLDNAARDASALAEVLRSHAGFPTPQLILDAEATKANILDSLYGFMRTNPDDRLIVFFAGHGAYTPAFPRERGFLVPYDARRTSLASLISWDELTSAAATFPAKHVLFLIDACFSGLANRRRLLSGSMRFLRLNLIKRCRQVITAGTGIQTVADVGDAMRGHSPMTSTLIEAIGGRAAYEDGIITAANVASYVYNKVARDTDARQRPDYDQYEGDGDFVFVAPQGLSRPQGGTELLAPVPGIIVPEESAGDPLLGARVKGYLADPGAGLRLHDVVTGEIRRVIGLIADDRLPQESEWTDADFRNQVMKYDAALYDLCGVQALLAYWSAPSNVLTLAPRRLFDRITPWFNVITEPMRLQFYPPLCLLYAGGIAAVAAGRYDTLFTLLTSPMSGFGPWKSESEPLLATVTTGIGKRVSFRAMPGLEHDDFAQSSYLHRTLQPILDDALFLGSDYEEAFDKFELLYALENGNYRHRRFGEAWFPTGRFADTDTDPPPALTRLRTEASSKGDDWAPLKAGFFGGMSQVFTRLADKLEAHIRSTA